MARRKQTGPVPRQGPGFLAPVDMPAQTYQWNKRAVVDQPVPTVDGVASDPHQQVVAQGPPVQVAAPEVSAPPAGNPAAPASNWGAVSAAPPSLVYPGSAPPQVLPEPVSVWGIGAACVVALGLPAGAFVLMRFVAVPGIGGTNWGLLIGVVTLAFAIAGMVGHLASERRYVGGRVRAAIAAGLSLASSALVLQLIASHPRKFGFDLSAPMMLSVLLPAALAAFVAYRPIE